MGFLSKLFSNTVFTYKPDFSKTEYDNWLEYMHVGGTTAEWKELKKQNNWKFRPDPLEKFSKYSSEYKPIFSEYSELLSTIKEQWSILYKSGNYTSRLAKAVEKNCINAISYFQKLQTIDQKYNQKPLSGSPAFTKLALLYERQGDYENSISICKIACHFGVDESARLKRMLKKAGRAPNPEELKLIDS